MDAWYSTVLLGGTQRQVEARDSSLRLVETATSKKTWNEVDVVVVKTISM